MNNARAGEPLNDGRRQIIGFLLPIASKPRGMGAIDLDRINMARVKSGNRLHALAGEGRPV